MSKRYFSSFLILIILFIFPNIVAFPAPLTLFGKYGDIYPYIIQDGGYLNDKAMSSDAYDDYYFLYINDNKYTGILFNSEDKGREAICKDQSIAGLRVSRKIFVPETENRARYLEILSNLTDREICVNIRIGGDLGSDADTVIVSTSDGDKIFEDTDTWLVTDDSYYVAKDPSLGHIFEGQCAKESVDTVFASNGDDKPYYQWDQVCIAPGQTKVLMHFAVQQTERSQAINEANNIQTLSAEGVLSGLSDFERSNIVNWCLPPKLKSTYPFASDENININSRIYTYFNKEINSATVNSDTFLVTGTVSGDITGSPDYHPKIKMIEFSSSSNFTPDEEITVELTTQLMDIDNIGFTGYQWSFTVGNIADDDPPPPISDIIALDDQDGGIDVTWSSCEATDLAYYKLYRDTSAIFDITGLEPLSISIPVDNTIQLFKDIPPSIGIQYYYAVTAFDRNGNEDQSVLHYCPVCSTSNTRQPQSPGNISITVEDEKTLKVSWAPNSEHDLEGYIISYGFENGNYRQFIPLVGNITEYTLDNLISGETYSITISAYDNHHNESLHSVKVLATTYLNSRISKNPNSSDQPAVEIDTAGNVHIVWVDDRNANYELYYTMIDQNRNPLIKETRLTFDEWDSKRPSIVIDSLDKVSIIWQNIREENSEIYFVKIDPSLDDQDDHTYNKPPPKIVNDTAVISGDGKKPYYPRIAMDSEDNIHIVWEDSHRILYKKIDPNGFTLIEETEIYSDEDLDESNPVIGVDSNQNIHIIFIFDCQLYYRMLNGRTGSTLIETTRITNGDKNNPCWQSLLINKQNQVIVIWQDQRGKNSEVYFMKIDPQMDDQDNDEADISTIKIISDTPLTLDDGMGSKFPTAAIDLFDRCHITWYENWSEANSGDLHYMVLNEQGDIIKDKIPLTKGNTATTTTEWTLGQISINKINGYTHIVWCDDRKANHEIYYASIPPPFPQIISRLPESNASNVPLNSFIFLAFSKNMDEAGLEGALGVHGTKSGPITTEDISYDNQLYTLQFIPSLPYKSGETITITLSQEAKDIKGIELPSDTVWSFTTGQAPDITEPSMISGLIAQDVSNDNGGQIEITWHSCLSNDFLYYHIYRDTNNIADINTLAAPIGISTFNRYLDTTTEDGEDYYYFVTSVDQCGQENTQVMSFGPVRSRENIPPAVPIIENYQVNENSVTLTWQTNSDIDLAKYKVYWYSTSDPSVNSKIISAGETSCIIDLQSCTSFYFYMTALDINGNESDESEKIDFNTYDPTDLQPPTGLQIEAGESLVYLNWEDNDECDILQYNIYRSRCDESCGHILDSLMIGTTDDTQYTDLNVFGGICYCYCITAEDKLHNKSAASNIEEVTPDDTEAPAIPNGLLLLPGNGLINLTWAPNPEPDLAKYRINYGAASGDYTTPEIVEGTTHQLTGLKNNCKYFIVVEAYDQKGNNSGYTNELSAMPQRLESIILVDDDGNSTYQSQKYFIYVLRANELGYNLWTVAEQGGAPPFDYLSQYDYDIVIWSTADDDSPPPLCRSDIDKDCLQDYLGQGGRLFLSGQFVATNESNFAKDYLHINSYKEYISNPPDSRAVGIIDDPISDGVDVSLSFPGKSDVYPLIPDDSATTIFNNEQGDPIALRFADPQTFYRIVYFAFPFEALSTTEGAPNNQDTIFGRIIHWLSAPKIVAAYPEDDATEVPANTDLLIFFSEDMDIDVLKLNSSVITVTGNRDYTGTFPTYNNSICRLRFDPDSDFTPNEKVMVTFGREINDYHGEILESVYTWSFTIGTTTDTNAPLPVNGLVAYMTEDRNVQLNWDKNMEPDLDFYKIYRETFSFSYVDNLTPIAIVYINTYHDSTTITDQDYYYAVTAVDIYGNEDKSVIFTTPDYAKIIFVNANNSPGGNGATWGQAFNSIQKAIDKVENPNDQIYQIWVAQGIYGKIKLKEGIYLYGGFIGNESILEERDYRSNETLIDGNHEDMAVTGANDAWIDGFTIINGLADCGGGICCKGTSPIIVNCLIKGNVAMNKGGGIYCNANAYPIIINNEIRNNKAYNGGGIAIEYNIDSSPEIRNNIFVDNQANEYGGGIYCNDVSLLNIINNLIVRNQAGYGGGAYIYDSFVNFTNCTLFGNNASYGGDGIRVVGNNSTLTIKNAILWNKGNEIDFNPWFENIEISYSDIRGGYQGTGNIEKDPLFVDPINSIFHLAAGSPCRDSGDPNYPDGVDPDGSYPDMGAYGGPGANWSPIIYGRDRYWMEIGNNYAIKILASIPDPKASLSYISDNPKFFIDPNTNTGVINYTPQVEDQGTHRVRITVQYCGGSQWPEGTKDISLGVWDNIHNIPKVYVKAATDVNAVSKGDGKSWNTALSTIQEGIDTAYDGYPDVWVAKGTYKENIILKDQINLYGGFDGTTEVNPRRDYQEYETIIDGNREGHVVTGANNARIDGFTIINGAAEYGGGIYCDYTSTTISQCKIRNNEATQKGGGIYCTWARPTIEDNEIYNNRAPSGGGIFSEYSFLIIQDNVITDNISQNRNGVEIYGAAKSTIIMENSAVINVCGGDDTNLNIIFTDNSSNIEMINSVILPKPSKYIITVNEAYRMLADTYNPMPVDPIDLLFTPIGKVIPRATKSFMSTAEDPNLIWTLEIENSGGGITSSNNTLGEYISGPNENKIDVVKVVGNQGSIGWAIINVVAEMRDPGLAIIICGSYPRETSNEVDLFNTEVGEAADFAYRTFINQGFQKQNIIYLHSNPVLSQLYEEDPNILSQLSGERIDSYLNESKYKLSLFDPDIDNGIQDKIKVVLYIVGHGKKEKKDEKDGYLYKYNFNDSVFLNPNQVDSILSIDPNRLPDGKNKEIISIPILDFCYAGGFINKLAGDNRICITSCNDEETIILPNLPCFNNLFFHNIRQGGKIDVSFKKVLSFLSEAPQTFELPLPQLEADGDDYHNEDDDDYIKANIYLGLDMFGGGDWDGIKETSEQTQYISDSNGVKLWARTFNPSENIRIFCYIKPPYYSRKPFDIELFKDPDEAKYKLRQQDREIFQSGGIYIVTVYALDQRYSPPNISKPKNIFIYHAGKDSFEDDNDFNHAETILIGRKHNHTLHNDDYEDWHCFYGHKGIDYNYEFTIEDASSISQVGIPPIQISVYDGNLNNLNTQYWSCPDYGNYYLQIKRNYPSNDLIFYNISVQKIPGAGSGLATIYGRVTTTDGEGVNGLKVQLSPNSQKNYDITGNFEKGLQEFFNNYLAKNFEKFVDQRTGDGWYQIFNVPIQNYTLQVVETKNFEIIYTDPYIIDNLTAGAKIIRNIELDPGLLDDVDPNSLKYKKNVRGWIEEDYDQYFKDCNKNPDDYPYDEIKKIEEGDELTNLEKYAYGKEDFNKSYFKTFLYQGLNLFPFSYAKEPGVTHFVAQNLVEGDSIYKYNEDPNMPKWERTSWDSGPNFKLERGKGYLIYKNPNQVFRQFIIQEKQSIDIDIDSKPGFRLRHISSLTRKPKYTSFGLTDANKVQSISRYDQRRGAWEASYLFFDKSTGDMFDILPNEAYLINKKGK